MVAKGNDKVKKNEFTGSIIEKNKKCLISMSVRWWHGYISESEVH